MGHFLAPWVCARAGANSVAFSVIHPTPEEQELERLKQEAELEARRKAAEDAARKLDEARKKAEEEKAAREGSVKDATADTPSTGGETANSQAAAPPLADSSTQDADRDEEKTAEGEKPVPDEERPNYFGAS